MQPAKKYRDSLLKALKDPISRRAKLKRVSLCKMLSHRGNPHLQSVMHLLQAAGLSARPGVCNFLGGSIV